MQVRLIIFLAALSFVGDLYGQVFPAAVATDADLLVGRDLASSSLVSLLSYDATTFAVISASTFGNNGVVTIGSEQIFCTTFSGVTFSSCTRGYGGTSATSHAAGTSVYGYNVAAYHNVLKDEIIAIETALGPYLNHPLRKGTTLPATCAVGDVFYDTDATAGSNLYGCTATNTWTVQAGGGGGSMVYPGVGLPISTGAAWGTSLSPTVNKVIIGGSGPVWAVSPYTLALPGAVGAVLYSDGTNWTRSTAPAISAANMTSFPTLNQSTTGTAAALSATLTEARFPAMDGDVVNSAGDLTTQVAKINGTTVPVNSTADQVLITTSSAVGAWKSVTNCGDATHALAYNTSTHTFSCQAISAALTGLEVTSTAGWSAVDYLTSTAASSGRTLQQSGIQVTGASKDGLYALSGLTSGDGTTPSLIKWRKGTPPSAPAGSYDLSEYVDTADGLKKIKNTANAVSVIGVLLASQSGMVKAASGVLSVGIANTDYMPAISGTGTLKVTAGAVGLVSGTATDCVTVNGSSAACGSGGGGGSSGGGNYSYAFTTQTSISMLGTAHGLNTNRILVSCYNSSTPAAKIEPNSVTVHPTTFDIAVTFTVAQSGTCIVNGSSFANYKEAFTSQTSITVLGATHGFSTNKILVSCYDNATPANWVEPNTVSVHPTTYDVAIGFTSAQSGSCILNGNSGTGGGMRVSVPATATTACTTGAWAADTTNFYVCVATDTWRRVGVASW